MNASLRRVYVPADDGAQIHVRLGGAGPAVLLIPDSPGSGAALARLIGLDRMVALGKGGGSLRFSVAGPVGAPGSEQIVLSDPGLGAYKKLVIADGRLVGVVLFGDTADGLWYLDLIRSGVSIEPYRQDLAFGRALVERIAA